MSSNRNIAVITGGGKGLGKAAALALGAQGYTVVVGYHTDRESAEGVVKHLRNVGREAIHLPVDVSCKESVTYLFSEINTQLGAVNVLVNNAGILQQKPFSEITEQDWDAMISTNLKSVFLCCQLVLPAMIAQGGGSIINISSSGGQLGGTLAVHYSASKAGVIALTKSFSRLGAPHGVRVNCIAPGLIETNMTRDEISSESGRIKIQQQILLGRAGKPEEIGSVVVFLASDQASYITGQTICPNGGLFLG
jgi:acetoacetyl-CoA reductase/3-oxoacyl-[acyl-carrier protein] reductase